MNLVLKDKLCRCLLYAPLPPLAVDGLEQGHMNLHAILSAVCHQPLTPFTPFTPMPVLVCRPPSPTTRPPAPPWCPVHAGRHPVGRPVHQGLHDEQGPAGLQDQHENWGEYTALPYPAPHQSTLQPRWHLTVVTLLRPLQIEMPMELHEDLAVLEVSSPSSSRRTTPTNLPSQIKHPAVHDAPVYYP